MIHYGTLFIIKSLSGAKSTFYRWSERLEIKSPLRCTEITFAKGTM